MQSLVEYFAYLLLALLIHLIPHSLALSTPEKSPEEAIINKGYDLETPVLLCEKQQDSPDKPSWCRPYSEATYYYAIVSAS